MGPDWLPGMVPGVMTVNKRTLRNLNPFPMDIRSFVSVLEKHSFYSVHFIFPFSFRPLFPHSIFYAFGIILSLIFHCRYYMKCRNHNTSCRRRNILSCLFDAPKRETFSGKGRQWKFAALRRDSEETQIAWSFTSKAYLLILQIFIGYYHFHF